MPFDGLTIPFAVERSRRNPVRQAQRNLTINAGDDVTLAVQVYDTEGAPLNLGGAVVTLSIYWMGDGWSGWGYGGTDYGCGFDTYPMQAIYQGIGLNAPGTGGQSQITLGRGISATMRGRYGMVVALDDSYGGAVLSRGVLDVLRGPVTPRYVVPVDVSPGIGIVGVAADGMGLLDNIGVPTAGVTTVGTGSALNSGILGQMILAV